MSGSVVNITRDHDQVAMNAGGDVQQDSTPEGRSHGGSNARYLALVETRIGGDHRHRGGGGLLRG